MIKDHSGGDSIKLSHEISALKEANRILEEKIQVGNFKNSSYVCIYFLFVYVCIYLFIHKILHVCTYYIF